MKASAALSALGATLFFVDLMHAFGQKLPLLLILLKVKTIVQDLTKEHRKCSFLQIRKVPLHVDPVFPLRTKADLYHQNVVEALFLLKKASR